MKYLFGVICLGMALSLPGRESGFARVDADGVMRWEDSGGEVALFGVNYYPPFTVDFYQIARMGLDHKAVMRQDMAHLRRLGLDCLRIHCFDRQFSREDGSLIDNIHLELLDDLIALCAESGFHIVLTPIAWWGGTSWVGETVGFSDRFTMPQMTADREAWQIQARFLKAFAEHRNRYTGKRYGEDPTIVAFECINEPIYPKNHPDEAVTAYINTLADALRAGGARQPIFYNSWQGRNAAAGKARIDGITGSTYPTGLVAGHALTEPLLGTIHASSLHPDASVTTKAKMIYEFDAADTPGAYMYPALAKLFRAEGVQIANQFQYDPMVLADHNANWQTHHLNLVYTPQKAISFAIAAEVFRTLPRGGRYTPAVDRIAFPPFLVSVAGNLSELATATRYYYTSTPQTPPPDPVRLEHIWGYGNSAVVTWPGTGAYFLDKLAPGLWRLQIYPDIFVHTDPYSGGENRKIALLPTRHPLRLNLPDLGEAFTVVKKSPSKNEPPLRAANGSCTLEDGDYWVYAHAAPASGLADPTPPYVILSERDATPRMTVSLPIQNRANRPIPVTVDAVFTPSIEAELTGYRLADFQAPTRATHPLTIGLNRLPCEIPADRIALAFAIRDTDRRPLVRYPTLETRNAGWIPTRAFTPKPLDANREKVQPLSHGFTCRPRWEEGRLTLDWEAVGAGNGSCAGIRIPFRFEENAPSGDTPYLIRLTLTNPTPNEVRFELGFGEPRGGLGADLHLSPGTTTLLLSPKDLRPLWGLKARADFRWEKVDVLSILTGAWLWNNAAIPAQKVEIAELAIAPAQVGFEVALRHRAGEWNFFDPHPLRLSWIQGASTRMTFDERARPAFHLETKGFTQPDQPDSIGWRAACDSARFIEQFPEARTDTAILLHARACYPETTRLEVVLVNRDETPWGTVVPLTTEWQEIRIPLSQLTFFAHWRTVAKPGSPADLKNTARFQFCFGRWLYPDTADRRHGVEVSAIRLEEKPAGAL